MHEETLMIDHNEDYIHYLQNVEQLASLRDNSNFASREESKEGEKLVCWTDYEVSKPHKIMSGIIVKLTMGVFGLNLLLLKTENWKHCSKIIFKYVNSIVRPIFNIF